MNNKPAELPEDLECFTLGPLPTNAYLIEDKYLIDPGGMNPNLRSKLDDTVECLEAILLTHCHWDHIDGINDILELYPDCKILCHSDEFEMLSDPEQNFSTMRGDSGFHLKRMLLLNPLRSGLMGRNSKFSKPRDIHRAGSVFIGKTGMPYCPGMPCLNEALDGPTFPVVIRTS